MAKSFISSDSETGEAGSMIQKYAEKVAQALETETNKMRERAAQDSSEIIARSRQEAEKIIARAKEEARGQSEKLLAGLREQAEQTLKESREKASEEARQESEKVINETWDRISQVISNTLENGITRAKDDFVRAADEARSKLESERSKLLAITQNIEQVISQTGTNIQAGIDHLTSVIGETGNKLQELNRAPGNGSAGAPQPEDITPVKTIYTVKLKKQDDEPPAEKTASAASELPEHSEVSGSAEELMREGLALLSSGKNQEALEAFEKVTELDPKNPIAWRKKGAALDKLGRHDESLKAYGKAIELAPNYISECLSSELAIARRAGQTESDEIKEAGKEPKKQNAENGTAARLASLSKRFVSTRFF